MNIRLCTAQDKDAWIALNSAFMDYEITDPQFWDQGSAVSRHQQLAETFDDAMEHPESILLFLLEDSSLLGFANVAVMYSVWAGGFILILDDLFIQQMHRGKGLGRQAMSLLEDYAKTHGYRRLQFWSEHSNPSAFAFYTALGYTSEDMKFYVKHL